MMGNKKRKNTVVRGALLVLLVGVLLIATTGCGGDSNNAYEPQEPGSGYEYVEFEEGQPICISVTKIGKKQFIEKYSDYYSDPEFAHSMLWVYEQTHDGDSIFINPDYITFYNTAIGSGETLDDSYNLGFGPLNIPLDTKIDNTYSANLFNSDTSKQIERWINLISCNPAATDLIQNEFLSQYTKQPIDKYDASAEYGRNLYDNLASTVGKYGDYCIFTILPATEDFNEKNLTVFSSTVIRNDNGGFDTYTKMRIQVEDFTQIDDDGDALMSTETLDVQLVYTRIALSMNDDGSTKFSEKTVFGIL